MPIHLRRDSVRNLCDAQTVCQPVAAIDPAIATRNARKAANERELAGIAAAPVILTAPGPFRVIVLDPPWSMKKIERRVRPNQVGFDYPSMTEDELAAFDVAAMADDDCHLFCWATQKHRRFAEQLVVLWGFRLAEFLMVWHKNGGMQPFRSPQYNCEFVVYARRGSPVFTSTKAFPTCFYAPRRGHSRKPDEFYDIVRRVTAGPRIDVFSREPREGFAQYGNEVNKFAAH